MNIFEELDRVLEGQPYGELLKKGAKILLEKKALMFLILSQTLFIAGAYAYWETSTPVYSERRIPEEMFGIRRCNAFASSFYNSLCHRLGRKWGVKKSAIVLSFGWTFFCSFMMFLVHPSLTIILVIILESTFATRHPIIEFGKTP